MEKSKENLSSVWRFKRLTTTTTTNLFNFYSFRRKCRIKALIIWFKCKLKLVDWIEIIMIGNSILSLRWSWNFMETIEIYSIRYIYTDCEYPDIFECDKFSCGIFFVLYFISHQSTKINITKYSISSRNIQIDCAIPTN